MAKSERIQLYLEPVQRKALEQFKEHNFVQKDSIAVEMLMMRGLSAWQKENPNLKVAVQQKMDF